MFNTYLPLAQAFFKKDPEYLFYEPLWGSLFFECLNVATKRIRFPFMSKAFTYPYECLKSIDNKTWHILTHTEAKEKFARYYNLEEFTLIRYILNTTINARSILLENIKIELPFRPTFCIISHLSTKGCNKWTKLLKMNLMQKSKIAHYENI